jgi:hypothetical protein
MISGGGVGCSCLWLKGVVATIAAIGLAVLAIVVAVVVITGGHIAAAAVACRNADACRCAGSTATVSALLPTL